MKLSIILPTLRRDNAMRCIQSINVNTFGDYEIIIVSTTEILDHVDNIRVIDDKKIGTTYAIQKGLEKASGNYVVVLSDDALVCPHWADHMLKILDRQSKDKIILGNFEVFDNTGTMPHIGYFGIIFSMFPIMRRDDIKKLGVYYSSEFNCFYSDPNLGIEVNQAHGEVITVPMAKIYHAYNPDLIMQANKNAYWEHDEKIFKEKWGHLGEWKGCEVIK